MPHAWEDRAGRPVAPTGDIPALVLRAQGQRCSSSRRLCQSSPADNKLFLPRHFSHGPRAACQDFQPLQEGQGAGTLLFSAGTVRWLPGKRPERGITSDPLARVCSGSKIPSPHSVQCARTLRDCCVPTHAWGGGHHVLFASKSWDDSLPCTILLLSE